MFYSDPEFARRLLASLGCGVLAIDERGRLCALNAEAQRVLGCPAGPPERALGADCRLALAARPVIARLLLEAARGRACHTRAELALEPGRDGEPGRTLGLSLAPVRDDTGAIRGAALFFRDLSCFERLDEQERLRDRLAALGEMAAGMAHEIRNPLAAMGVMAELLRRRLAGREGELSLLAELTDELHAVEQVVGEGLDFVRATPPLLEEVDLPGIVERSLARARARVGFRGSVELDYEPDLPPLRADATQLQAVFGNLLVNAMEAMVGHREPDDQHLWLRVRTRSSVRESSPMRIAGCAAASASASASAPVPRERLAAGDAEGLGAIVGARAERSLLISIADNGPGIAPELRTRIFYPFFTTKDGGAGVGLATAQKIVASHGGRIDLEARPGGGSIFHVRMPLAEQGAQAQRRTAAGAGSDA